MAQKLHISDSVSKSLHLLSDGKCAICDCPLIQFDSKTSKSLYIGEMAHIQGEKPSSKRFNPNMTDIERQSLSNLILLCPSCHKKVDNQNSSITKEELYEYKNRQELKTLKNLDKKATDLRLKELSITLDYLSNPPIMPQKSEMDYYTVTISQKISKNCLSNNVAHIIKSGLTNFNLIDDYLNKQSNISLEFSENLRNVFVAKYKELAKIYKDPNELFSAMCEFANIPNNIVSIISAITVVTYFFQKCEIFEK